MPTILQLRRGSTAENDAYTGSVGELTVDTTLNTVRVHDGSTAGGTVVGKSTGNIQVAVTGDNEIDTSSGNLTIDSAGGTVTVDDNLTVSGNLTVNGTTTTVNSTNTTLDDNLLELNSGASSNANDSGIIIERGSTGDNAIIAWDESADKFIVGTTTATASDTGNLTISTGTLVANIEGAVTGNASTATALQTARNIAGQSFDGTGNITIASTDLSDTASIVLLNSSQTLTNKTLTTPVISSISNTGTLTLPTSTDTLVGRATTDTLTNKTIDAANNTLSNIGNSSLTNCSITINGSSVALGGSTTITAGCDWSVNSSYTNITVQDSPNTCINGYQNTIVGSNAGKCTRTAGGNTFIGAGAGRFNTTGGYNTAVGKNAGYEITTGCCNVVLGTSAGAGCGQVTLSTGSNNILIGHYAASSSSTVSNEITIGNTSHDLLRIPGLGSTDGQVLTYSSYYGGIVLAAAPSSAVNRCNGNNIVTDSIGGDGGQGSFNLLIGSNSGYNVTTGCSNIMLGSQSGYSTTSGSYNVFVGGSTGRCNTTGKHNVFIGDKSGCRNTIGVANIALGENAGRYNSVGLNNISIGKSANCKTTGSGVVSLGAYAGWCGTNAACSVNIGYFAGRSVSGACNVAIGFAAMMQNASQANVGIGARAGQSLEDGAACNVMLGAQAGCQAVNGTNNIAIGFDAQLSTTTASNEITIGNVTHNLLRIPGLGSTDGQVLTYSSSCGGIVLAAASGGGCDWSVNSSNTNITVQDNPNTNINGFNNILIGSYAGKSGTITANNNILIGGSAGYCVSTGVCNISIGTNAGDGITSGSCNVSIGTSANWSCNGGTITGNNNIVFGHYAAPSSSTASNEITLGNVTHNLLRIPGLGSTDGQVLTYSSSCGGIILAAASGGGGCDWSVNSSYTNITVQDNPNTCIGGYNNVLVGHSAGKCTRTASSNTFIGGSAGYFNTTGGNNVAVGRSSGAELTTGCCNILLGTFAGAGCGQVTLSTGSNNILIGHYAAPSSSGASNEITIGNVTHDLLRIPGLGSTDGHVLTYSSYYGGIVLEPIPSAAVKNCGSANIVTSSIGGDGGQGSRNILIGSNSGYYLTTGSDNIMLGSQSGYNTTSGSNNIFLGRNAGCSLVTGTNNVLIGYNAQASTTTANNEITIGNVTHNLLRIPGLGSTDGQVLTYSSACGGIVLAAASGGGGGCDYTPTSSTTNIVISETQNTTMTGSYNTAIGDNAGMCLTGGNYNTLIGGYAGMFSTSANSNTFVGSGAGRDTTTGSKNTSIGRSAGIGITTGNCNISIGDSANYKLGAYGVGTTTGNNNIVIGWYAQPSSEGASNEITIGNVTHNLLRIPGLGSTDGQVLTYSSSCGGIILAAASGGSAAAVNICNSNNVVSCIGGDGGSGTHNVLIGQYTGSLCTLTASAQSNIAIGRSALKTIHTGKQNIAIGDYNMASVTSGQYNISLGAFALGCSTVGCCNIAIGNSSLSYVGNNVTSIGNIGIGSQSGRWTSTSQYNIAIGHKSAYGAYAFGTGVSGNIAMGYNSGNSKGWNNITIGQCAGYASNSGMTGNNNIGIGTSVFSGSGLSISAYSNTAIGAYAMSVLSSGGKNTAVGANSMSCITSGEGNVAVGNYSLHDNQGGCENIAIGRFAMSSFMTPFNLQKNVAVGSQAGCAFNDAQCHVVLGYSAGRTTTTATNNIIIGAYAEASSVTASNEITLGNTSHTCIRANVTTISSLSDQRDKTNVCDLNVGLCFVNDLRPVTFDWDRRDGTMAGHKDVGFIAQDLDALQQKYDIEENLKIVLKENPERLEATPGKLIPILVKAIQELSAEVKKLKENK